MKWEDKVLAFCRKYNIPIEYLSDTLYEPKVIPMIRGKAFEFSVLIALESCLSSDEFIASKTAMNAQLGIHDKDVAVLHKPSSISLAIECKLSAKGSYRHHKDGTHTVKVKCMRSRTLGTEMVKRLAPQWGIAEALIRVHNDQYLPSDFDFVVTSIANAFYVTDAETGYFLLCQNG